MSYWIPFCLDQVTSCKYLLISCSLWSAFTFTVQKYFSFVCIGIIPDLSRGGPDAPPPPPSVPGRLPGTPSAAAALLLLLLPVSMRLEARPAGPSFCQRCCLARPQIKRPPKGPPGKVAQPISQDLCQKCFSAQVICSSLGPFHCYFKGARKGLQREKWKGGKLAVGSERWAVHFWVLTCHLKEKSSSSSVILRPDGWKRLHPFPSKRPSWRFYRRRNRHKTEIPKENKDHLYEGRLFFFNH